MYNIWCPKKKTMPLRILLILPQGLKTSRCVFPPCFLSNYSSSLFWK